MKRTKQNKGFTIVELLTVMAVIALLIGLLVPALALVKDRGKEIQQRAQFHAISAGLEMFRADFGDYPESKDNAYAPVHPVDSTVYTGANKLAEAMVGLDYLGFHPNSDFRADGANDVYDKFGNYVANQIVYAGLGAVNENWQTQPENIRARKGPYVDLENANAFRMEEIYYNHGNFHGDSLVLCDVFSRKRRAVDSKKTGTPILYFRARTLFSGQDTDANPDNSIYNYYDNAAILDLGMPDDSSMLHLLFEGDVAINFDNLIVNRNIPITPPRPYRAGSYILWSAGKDGSFGTADDIFNFTREAE